MTNQHWDTLNRGEQMAIAKIALRHIILKRDGWLTQYTLTGITREQFVLWLSSIELKALTGVIRELLEENQELRKELERRQT